MKRFFSGESTDGLPMVSKLAKLKDTIFSKLTNPTNDNNNNNDSSKHEMPLKYTTRSSSPVPIEQSSFQNSSDTPITARQLEAYYNSLKMQNEELIDDLNKSSEQEKNMGNKISQKDTNTWNNAESTNLDLGNSIDDHSEINPSKNEENAVILFDDDNNNNKKSESEMDIDEYSRYLGLPPIVSKPDPLERANLVQLKKMMELEKYRRYRLSYLREHTRHVNRSGINKVSKNIIKQRYLKQAKNVGKLPKERQNISGVFGISLLDTVDDKDIDLKEENNDSIKPLDNNIKKKLKFTDTDSPAATFTISSKPKSFAAPEVKEKRVTEEITTTKEDKSENVTPSFSFQNEELSTTDTEKPKISFDAKPSVAFKFDKGESTGNNDTNFKPPELNAKPIFSFGKLEEKKEPFPKKEEEKKPVFSFGSNASVPVVEQKEAKPLMLNKPKEDKKPSITFGNTANSGNNLKHVSIETIPDAEALNDSSMDIGGKRKRPQLTKDDTETKAKSSTFSFSKPEPTSNVSSEAATKLPSLFGPTSSSTTNTPSLSFGSKTPVSSNSGFQFGKSTALESLKVPTAPSTNADTTTNLTTKDNDKPKFMFGQPAKTTTSSSSSSSSSMPSFGSLSAKTGEEKKSEVTQATEKKPALDFSSASTISKPDDTANFSFSAVTNSEGPKLSFGDSAKGDSAKTTDNKQKSSFGAFGSTNTSNTPKVAFGNNNGGFSFGSSTPGFSMDKKDNDKPKEEAAKSGLPAKPLFGNLNSGSGTETKVEEVSKPTFSFGANKPAASLSSVAENKSSVSAFGSNLTPSAPKTATTNQFTFGSTPSTNNLSTSVKPTSSTSSGFNFNVKDNSTPNSTSLFSGFGNNNSSTKSISTGTENSNLPKIPNLPKIEQPKNSISIAPQTGFSFGGNSNANTTPTQSGFGTATNDNNNNNAFGSTTNTANSAKSAFGGLSSTAFNFGTGSGGASNTQNNTIGFGAQSQPSNTNSNQTTGKIFSFNNSAFPSLPQVPKPALNGFGNNNGTAQNNNFNFGGTPSPGFSAGANSGFGTNNNNNNGNLFGGNNTNTPINNGFSIGTNNGGFNSNNTSRSSTPSFNFTGQNTGSVDPSAIFQQTMGGQGGTPPPGAGGISGRRKAYPRSMRGRR